MLLQHAFLPYARVMQPSVRALQHIARIALLAKRVTRRLMVPMAPQKSSKAKIIEPTRLLRKQSQLKQIELGHSEPVRKALR